MQMLEQSDCEVIKHIVTLLSPPESICIYVHVRTVRACSMQQHLFLRTWSRPITFRREQAELECMRIVEDVRRYLEVCLRIPTLLRQNISSRVHHANLEPHSVTSLRLPPSLQLHSFELVEQEGHLERGGHVCLDGGLGSYPSAISFTSRGFLEIVRGLIILTRILG